MWGVGPAGPAPSPSGYPSGVDFFVVSLVLLNDAGALLVVRKRGTSVFMQPGGKVEPGETHRQAAVREASEELGIDLDPDALALLGTWTAAAANEPGLVLGSDVFTAPLVGEPAASGEIEEIRWVALSDADALAAQPLAPLLTEHVIPALLAVRT